MKAWGVSSLFYIHESGRRATDLQGGEFVFFLLTPNDEVSDYWRVSVSATHSPTLINLAISQAHTFGSYGTAKLFMQDTEVPAIE